MKPFPFSPPKAKTSLPPDNPFLSFVTSFLAPPFCFVQPLRPVRPASGWHAARLTAEEMVKFTRLDFVFSRLRHTGSLGGLWNRLLHSDLGLSHVPGVGLVTLPAETSVCVGLHS